MLSFIILWRGVWTRYPQKYPTDDKECARGGVIKLTIIVALDDFDGTTKLCGDISEIFDKVKKCQI
jgi:hypothetical protein